MSGQGSTGQIYDVIIIGGGPGGLTAGIYGARAGLKALLIQGASTVSQITVTDLIENYPGLPGGIGGFELVENFRKQAREFGLEITDADVSGVAGFPLGDISGWEVAAGGQSYRAISLIVATGATWRRLGVPGEEEYIGKGVSFCATCDGPFYRNRAVAVIGGGDTAIQEAIFLTHFASKVTVIHRRDRLRATAILRDRALKNEKIGFLWDSVLTEIRGGDFVEKLLVKNVNTKVISELSAEGVFIFVGLTPNTDLVRGIVELDDKGYILADQDMKTSAPGIFACGDCIQKSLRQVVTACGDGANAAFAAQHYVEAAKGEAY
ncbi:MAG: thioredoxin-disulfide reductase [Smithellaceae bacterium]|nr:thioredoxin-disulfide reductase [Smithellaceae bacterium]